MTEEKKKLDDEKLEDVAGGFWIVPDVDYAAEKAAEETWENRDRENRPHRRGHPGPRLTDSPES